MGARLQLAMSSAEIDALSVPRWKKTILRAMARYGLFLGDTGGDAWGIELQSPDRASRASAGLTPSPPSPRRSGPAKKQRWALRRQPARRSRLGALFARDRSPRLRGEAADAARHTPGLPLGLPVNPEPPDDWLVARRRNRAIESSRVTLRRGQASTCEERTSRKYALLDSRREPRRSTTRRSRRRTDMRSTCTAVPSRCSQASAPEPRSSRSSAASSSCVSRGCERARTDLPARVGELASAPPRHAAAARLDTASPNHCVDAGPGHRLLVPTKSVGRHVAGHAEAARSGTRELEPRSGRRRRTSRRRLSQAGSGSRPGERHAPVAAGEEQPSCPSSPPG